MAQNIKKYELEDFQGIDENGLRGGVLVDYEFCIPQGDHFMNEVKSIDPTAQFHPGSRGRIGCRPDQVLVLISTQSGWQRVLDSLSQLSYIEKIQPTFWE